MHFPGPCRGAQTSSYQGDKGQRGNSSEQVYLHIPVRPSFMVVLENPRKTPKPQQTQKAEEVESKNSQV